MCTWVSWYQTVSILDFRTGPHSGGPPFRRSAILGVTVRVRVRLTLADLRNGGPPESWIFWELMMMEMVVTTND